MEKFIKGAKMIAVESIEKFLLENNNNNDDISLLTMTGRKSNKVKRTTQ